jgi:hypothetical protein
MVLPCHFGACFNIFSYNFLIHFAYLPAIHRTDYRCVTRCVLTIWCNICSEKKTASLALCDSPHGTEKRRSPLDMHSLKYIAKVNSYKNHAVEQEEPEKLTSNTKYEKWKYFNPVHES